MKTVQVNAGSKSYPVFIGANTVSKLNAFLQQHLPNCSKILIITDETVAGLHLAALQKEITAFPVVSHIVPAGEHAKTFDVFYGCHSFALEEKLDRKSLIIALGGGAVGDLAGFVASSFMRGIPFIQVPTTILAHDSAVGGKVAINHPLGKNMIGAFYQPEAVFYETSYIATLPVIELRSGFGEVMKHALISNMEFYESLLNDITDLAGVPEEQWAVLLEKGILVKSDVVAQDEKEANVRAYLNFGHTLGHAIEAEMGYGNMSHGEAVVIGMLFALRLSEKKLGLDFDSSRFTQWLKTLGYATEVPSSLSVDALLDRMKQDKKSVKGTIHFVLLKSIGTPKLVQMDEQELREELHIFKGE
ncbi:MULTISPECIES: 3-dehydroquinate synthase [unclassified Niallia]|uniref:3-dehydroquinate synthase n=1 Tax=unclassified Niallia TaxID=2837522 RepID=UPI001EDB3099|nr:MULTISPECIES: 3-dehydroquinate synthase [unclassified Niallia]MDL0435754.1 3-dehydroquinate synthase [Niallia sp. SS-2023]UPO86416.1 3-dehydroquinate synthase [Niallia sp. Man26]